MYCLLGDCQRHQLLHSDAGQLGIPSVDVGDAGGEPDGLPYAMHIGTNKVMRRCAVADQQVGQASENVSAGAACRGHILYTGLTINMPVCGWRQQLVRQRPGRTCRGCTVHSVQQVDNTTTLVALTHGRVN